MISRVNGWNRDLQYRYNPHGIEDPVVPKVRFSYTINVPRHNIQLLYKIKSILELVISLKIHLNVSILYLIKTSD